MFLPHLKHLFSSIKKHDSNRAFTLVELLIVIGVLVILSTAAVLVINPVELMKQSRDSSRLSDLNALNKSLSLYRIDSTAVLADTTKVYISVPSAQTNCSDVSGLPTLASGYTYVCVPQTSLTNINGTGWLPVDFSNLNQSGGAPLSHLPVDPSNNATYFEAFRAGSDGTWVLTSKLESQKYLPNAEADGGQDTDRIELANPTLWGETLGLYDTTNPSVSSFSPADNATTASVSADLVITFTEPVVTTTGTSNTIVIKKTSDNSIIETIGPADYNMGTLKITGSGTNTITINPTATLAYSTDYYVQIGVDAFDDAAGNSYAGIVDPNTTSWSFRTLTPTYALGLVRSSSQYARIIDSSQSGLDLNSNWSMEAWVKLSQLPSAISGNYMIATKYLGAGNQRSYLFGISWTSDRLYIGYDATGGGVDGSRTSINAASTFDANDVGVWRHVAATVNISTKTVVFYKDGVPLTTSVYLANASTIYNGTAPFIIGATGDGTNIFNGLIDEVRVWNDIRTPQEITDNYNHALVGNESNLVGYWKLNNNYLDETTNNNDLTSVNSPAFSTDTPF